MSRTSFFGREATRKSTVAPMAIVSVALFAPSCGAERTDDMAGALDAGDTGPGFVLADGAFEADPPPIGDPKTCEEAARNRSYVGCDFWPTVVANSVWSVFDFAAVVANAGDEEARVRVTGPAGFTKEAVVGPGRLVKIYLPWVAKLKGPDADECGQSTAIKETVRADGSAYHVVTSKPVTIYQFNALEYQGKGGAATKTWAACPGSEVDCDDGSGFIAPIGCYSFSNDASLLLPSTAWTENYRIVGARGAAGMSSYVAITASRDDTGVTVKLGSKGRILAGGGLPYTQGNGSATFNLNQGDVIELVATAGASFDLSGSLVQASKPVQVIAGVPCITNPSGVLACDHVEESVLPAETLGREYVVTGPTGPNGDKPGHTVRLYGNVDGTKLTYAPAKPTAAPETLNAGDVIDLGVVEDDFVVQGTAEFAVSTMMLGGTRVDPGAFGGLGDPSLSVFTAVEQHRKKYVFLAPDDYEVNYVDVVARAGTAIELDGLGPAGVPDPIGSTGWVVHRLELDKGPMGVGSHVLTSDRPVGIQVLGYGMYTSYQFPGGMNLSRIAPAPVK